MTENERKDTSPTKKTSGKTKFEIIVMVAGILLIAANLRAPITSVGPVITEITAQLKLTPVLVGLITTIPLIAFALLSTFTPGIAKKAGLERLLLYSLLVLTFGSFARSSGTVFFLFFGAALIGAAITVGNVLMPAFIKKEFPEKVGLVTGVYLVSMNFTSALAAGYSIRIGQMTGLGWKGSIGIWGLLALLAFFIWLAQINKQPVANLQDQPAATTASLWKSRLAWQVAILMGSQSFLFYSFAAWLPAVMQSWGMSADRSGWMLSYIQMAQLPMMFIGPIITNRMKDQTPLVWITFVLLILGLAGILIWKTDYIILCTILIGVSLGLAFTLAMMFFILRTQDPAMAANLSGMSQSVGYLIAACGPPLFGALYSITGSWYTPLGLTVLVAIVLLISGLASAKDRYVTPPATTS